MILLTRNKLLISLVCVLAGFMVAVQFKSTQEPVERDTRDLWEIRSQLQKEQKTQQKLYQQIAEAEMVIEQYQDNSEQQLIKTLSDSINELKEKAGLTEKSGKGVKIKISPIAENTGLVQVFPKITPELLHRLLNELFTYGATDVAIENERIISITPIRYVNGKTYVNNRALQSVPITVKVLANDATRLLDFIQVSQSKEDFAIENLDLTAEISNSITLPKYDSVINLDNVEVNETEETGEK